MTPIIGPITIPSTDTNYGVSSTLDVTVGIYNYGDVVVDDDASIVTPIYINADGGVTVVDVGNLDVTTGIDNAGTIFVIGAASITTPTYTNTGVTEFDNAVVLDGSVTNNGTGQFVISDATTGVSTFTNNSTSATAAGIEVDGSLSATSVVNNAGTFTNFGTITAAATVDNQAGGNFITTNALTAASVTNEGTMTASGTITTPTLTNSGTFSTGGLLTINGALVNAAGMATISDSLTVTVSISNAGQLLVGVAATIVTPNYVNTGDTIVISAAELDAAVTNNGAGQFIITAATSGVSTFTNNSTSGTAVDIARASSLTANSVVNNAGTFTNFGTITATTTVDNQAGGNFITTNALTAASVTNEGTMTASGTITTPTLTNNGNLSTGGALTIDGALFNTTPGNITVSTALILAGSLTDAGSIFLNSPEADLIGTGLTVQSGGTLDVAGGQVSAPLTVDKGGSVLVDGGAVAVTTLDGGALELATGASESGPIVFGALGGTLAFSTAVTPTEQIDGFGADGLIDVADLAFPTSEALTTAYSVIQVGVSESYLATFQEGSSSVQLTFQSATPLTVDSFTLSRDAAGTGTEIAAACYVRGTRILTDRGEVAIDELLIGDIVVTASGMQRPILWIGHRAIDVTRHPEPAAVRPVRVLAAAFGEGLPRRDLWLSPGHNVACEGALIPISALINRASVVQVEQDHVEYWHVELDAHDLLLAEGLPAESYLDCGNRTAFANAGAFIEAHPDFRPKHWAETFLLLATEGREVACVRALLFSRLPQLGFEITTDADPHVLADGRRVEPIWLAERRLAFEPPPGSRAITLSSRSFVPAYSPLSNGDVRELGLSIARFHIDGADFALDDWRLEAGWHVCEREDGRPVRRWTDGAAALPKGAKRVVIDLAGEGLYWRVPEDRVADLVA